MFSRFFSLFFHDTPAPPPKDLDTIPCTAFDLAARDVILTRTLVVNRQLDWEKLRSSLFELVETKFRKAGSRLALRNGVRHFLSLGNSNTYPVDSRATIRPMRLPRVLQFLAHRPNCPYLLVTLVPIL